MERENLKKCLKRIGSDLQIHGLPKIFKNRILALKVMWSLAFFAATYLTVRFLIESINEYTAYRVFNNINII